MAKKKKELKALLKVNDKIKILDRNKVYKIKSVKGDFYTWEDEDGKLNDKIGIIGVDNAIEKTKSIIRL